MVDRGGLCWLVPVLLFMIAQTTAAQETGSIRGVVYDKDFNAPLALAQVTLSETGQKVSATEQGNYVIEGVLPGNYTLVFSKDGYVRQVKSNVVVQSGQLIDVDAQLSGQFEDMDVFVVQDVRIGGGKEEDLLKLRAESPAQMDSIGKELISAIGASTAIDAIRAVAGTSVQDGKYAVVRGLPDRYVNSQMNGVRLPTADLDKRAVELDQFPAAVIESVQVSKTFTPDQQGDASGGAVNVVLKGIPDEAIFNISSQVSTNSNVFGRKDFLSYKGGGVGFWGIDDGGRDIQDEWYQPDGGDGKYTGAVGVNEMDAPIDYSWSVALGGKHTLEEEGITIGAFTNFFYKRDSSLTHGVNDDRWVDNALNPGKELRPRYSRGTPLILDNGFLTSLLDVEQGKQEVQWGGLGTFGLETEHHSLTLVYMYTRAAEDVATLATDTRGKESLSEWYGPTYENYDRTDPSHLGNTDGAFAAPYRRDETLKYSERTTQTLQLSGRHTIPVGDVEISDFFTLLDPQIDWTLAASSANLYEPDKRLFASTWSPIFAPGFTGVYTQNKPADVSTLGNLQRVWKTVDEESEQYFTNLKLPFEQWSGEKGYVKLGVFHDAVARTYTQDSFSNFNENNAFALIDWGESWTDLWVDQSHPITESIFDVGYEGNQEIAAWYWMADLPLTSFFKVIGGIRYESTDLTIKTQLDSNLTTVILPGNANALYPIDPATGKNLADVDFSQEDILPAIGFELKPIEQIIFRGSYTETVARQTFKELTPIQQQEYLGGDIFIGNPQLKMSAVKNYDLRLDYTPYQGGLLSVSWFRKDVKDPIEYEQRFAGFAYTTSVNYPKGWLTGWEFEIRQDLGYFWEDLSGLSIGANATLIKSQVTIPNQNTQDIGSLLETSGFPVETRDMVNTPAYLYNIYLRYELENTGTSLGLFYSVTGDTLLVGDGVGYTPAIYQEEYGTLNVTLSQKLGEHVKLTFQAKNLTDPAIETVYRSKYIGDDVTKTSYKKGIDFSFGISAEFKF